MQKIKSALISVFYKDGLEALIRTLHDNKIEILSTGGTQKFIEKLGVPCRSVEKITGYPSILGGRVKTLHPKIFGGILGRRELDKDVAEMKEYGLPEIDLVIVNLYPFEETLKNTKEESAIIEKIDIGGPTMIRAAAKNYQDVAVIADKADYETLNEMLANQDGALSIEQRRSFAAKAFWVAMNYDIAISNYFNGKLIPGFKEAKSLRYGENPHQKGIFYGDLDNTFEKLNGKSLSYNNLVDIDAALNLMRDFQDTKEAVFAVFKHTNACGVAQRETVEAAWEAALAGDPESAFGGVLICNKEINLSTAEKISQLFYEVLLAPSFSADALEVLKSKKNRVILKLKQNDGIKTLFKNILDGTLTQDVDEGNFDKWEEMGAQEATSSQKEDLTFANIVCKHLKSNAIALVKGKQLLGKGCGQTSRVDALRHAIEKAKALKFDLEGAVMASDAFFPFDDCVSLAQEAGIKAVIQPGGSIRDKDTIHFCRNNGIALVITGMRHFKH